ncbi:MAG TPA: AbrB/MazE/SpoVT family DNA-binding domain-containing protein [Alphaproteobacteria bacterium]|nr:AbrB/MazE/SpoVT family DNA-binding domain-containing protein [Alphaproteobacteria bacterium]
MKAQKSHFSGQKNEKEAMESRKVQVVGNNSYAVSLPKKWILSNHIKNHDIIFMNITDNNELILTKSINSQSNAKKVLIHVDDKNIDTLTEFIMFCYVKSIDHIKVTSKTIDHNILHSIQSAIKYLEGYSITHEDETSVEISFLFNDIQTNIKTIQLRMYYLIKLHVSSLENKQYKILEETEHAVDRMFYLSRRVLLSCMSDYSKKTENGIKNEEDILYLQIISKRMESISDNILRMRTMDPSKSDIATLSKIIVFLGKLMSQKEEATRIKSEFEKITISSKNHQAFARLNRIHDLCRDAFDAKINMEFNEKIKDYAVK